MTKLPMIFHSLPLPQNPAFVEFLYYEKMFFVPEVDRINGMWDEARVKKATLSGDDIYNDELRKSSVFFLESDEKNKWIYEKLGMLAQKSNYERYAFDLSGFAQELQLTQYECGDFFEWHMDFGPGEISNRKLSLTVQLSDPEEYEGGMLQFMINDRIVDAPRTRGTVIVFPSFIMHRVTPVTRGVRRSIVGWVSGMPYR